GFDDGRVVTSFHKSEESQATVRYPPRVFEDAAGIVNNALPQPATTRPDSLSSLEAQFADVLMGVWQAIHNESMKNVWDGVLSDHVMDYCDVQLQRSCHLILPSTVTSATLDIICSQETSRKDFGAPRCGIDFPPGFGPIRDVKSSHSSPLAQAQTMLGNQLYVASKQSIFQHFEELIAKELTNCLCVGVSSSTNLEQTSNCLDSGYIRHNVEPLPKPVCELVERKKAEPLIPCPESDGCARASISRWEWHNWVKNASPSERAHLRGHSIHTVVAAKYVFKSPKGRKKNLRFERSKIHRWGLFAVESIGAQEFVTEYVGELVRRKISDIREAQYEKSGIGSSYLFRLDDDFVPNCCTKVVTVQGKKKIFIYAKRHIRAGEEVTYDYKFPIDEKKIPCHCGSRR
ncbi:hypothetical protein EJB05_00373, partial [Eragrostis curvula]